jgi:hypothetical protein
MDNLRDMAIRVQDHLLEVMRPDLMTLPREPREPKVPYRRYPQHPIEYEMFLLRRKDKGKTDDEIL